MKTLFRHKFGFWIVDFGFKKKEISASLKFSNKTGKLYFEVFVQTLFSAIPAPAQWNAKLIPLSSFS